MTRHAEMERPDEVQEAEFARTERLTWPFPMTFEINTEQHRRIFAAITKALGHPRHRRDPYSRLRERNVFDPTYRPRHMNHRAEGAAS